MRTFTHHEGLMAAIPLANIDTDKILPGPFLKTISREGLGRHLFHTMRYDDTGSVRPDFVLNRAPWTSASILVALDNFGCGSSREHAPWALWDFGIRCVIAPSFADIFYNNCFKNGILPISLDRSSIDRLIEDATSEATARLAVDLPGQSITRHDRTIQKFDIEATRKETLLAGRDEISASLDRVREIETYERGRLSALPAIRIPVPA